MLPTSHNRAYQDLLTLLTEFEGHLDIAASKDRLSFLKTEFQKLEMWFEQNIAHLSQEDLELPSGAATSSQIAARWQAVQTEIKREFKLLSVDILFFASARQHATQTKRLKSITNRLTKLIGYCQVMLKNSG